MPEVEESHNHVCPFKIGDTVERVGASSGNFPVGQRGVVEGYCTISSNYDAIRVSSSDQRMFWKFFRPVVHPYA